MSVVWILIIGVAAFLILKRRPPLEIPEESQTAVKASGKCGPDAEWRLHEDGQLYITGSDAMYDYEPETTECPEKIAPWHPYRREVRSLVVDRGISCLGRWSFAYFFNMTSVTLACRISFLPQGCFFECESLDEIDIPKGVKRIGTNCFLDCIYLDTVHLPKGMLAILDGAFCDTGLVHINLPESLEEIHAFAFGHCQFLKEISIPDNVSYIHADAFYHSGVRVPPRG